VLAEVLQGVGSKVCSGGDTVTWFKLDDQFPDHPKMLRAGPDAGWLYVCGGCYCSRHLTDGLIPKEAVATLSTLRGATRLAARLVDVGAWHDRGDCYEMHAYLDYNPSRDDVESKRNSKQIAGAMGAAKRWGDVRHAGKNAPVPSPPPKEKENGRRKLRPPVDYAPSVAQVEYAETNGLGLDAERTAWLDWCEANGRTYASVTAGFSTWLRQAVNFGRGKSAANGHKPAPEKCPKCANTGAVVVDGVVRDCDCIRAFS
jgi:hypothetical protein